MYGETRTELLLESRVVISYAIRAMARRFARK